MHSCLNLWFIVFCHFVFTISFVGILFMSPPFAIFHSHLIFHIRSAASVIRIAYSLVAVFGVLLFSVKRLRLLPRIMSRLGGVHSRPRLDHSSSVSLQIVFCPVAGHSSVICFMLSSIWHN